MGLDMYLYCNSLPTCKDANAGLSKLEKEFNVPRGIAMYWRKANAIHRWFVANVQGGNDDCGTYDVSTTDLAVLHDTCKEVIESAELVESWTEESYDTAARQMVETPKLVLSDTAKAEELLPVQEGFFFGSMEYDEGYYRDLEATVAGIEAIMENLEPADRFGNVEHKDERGWYVRFQYRSSW